MGHIPFLFTIFQSILSQWGYKGWIVLVLFIFSFCMVCFYRYYHMQRQVKEAERIRTIIKSLRHDWMNHVQVIMGYQMLKQYDKVDLYLQKLTKRSSEERMISELTYSPLAAALLTIHYDYAQWNWSVRLDDSISTLSIRHQQKLFQTLIYLLPWITNKISSQVAWNEIKFDLSYDNQYFFFTFRFIGKGNDPKHKLKPIEWGALPKRLQFQKASYEWSENEHTLLLKMPNR